MVRDSSSSTVLGFRTLRPSFESVSWGNSHPISESVGWARQLKVWTLEPRLPGWNSSCSSQCLMPPCLSFSTYKMSVIIAVSHTVVRLLLLLKKMWLALGNLQMTDNYELHLIEVERTQGSFSIPGLGVWPSKLCLSDSLFSIRGMGKNNAASSKFLKSGRAKEEREQMWKKTQWVSLIPVCILFPDAFMLRLPEPSCCSQDPETASILLLAPDLFPFLENPGVSVLGSSWWSLCHFFGIICLVVALSGQAELP